MTSLIKSGVNIPMADLNRQLLDVHPSTPSPWSSFVHFHEIFREYWPHNRLKSPLCLRFHRMDYRPLLSPPLIHHPSLIDSTDNSDYTHYTLTNYRWLPWVSRLEDTVINRLEETVINRLKEMVTSRLEETPWMRGECLSPCVLWSCEILCK